MQFTKTFATRCFVSDDGFYCIKQINPFLGGKSVLLLSPEQVKHIIEDMVACMDSMEEAWFASLVEDEKPAPPEKEGG